MLHPVLRQRIAVALTAMLACGAAGAAERSPEALEAEVDRLTRTVDALLKRVETLEAEKRALAAPAPAPAVAPPQAAPAAPSARTPTAIAAETAGQDQAGTYGLEQSPLPDRGTFDEDELAASRLDNELPPGDEDLPGFILIPRTQTLLRVGGYAKVDAIVDSDDAGDRSQLITSAIPVGAQTGTGRFNLHARQTRFNIEARRPTSRGNLRFFLENDFYGPGGSYGYHLRHAFGQLGNTYAGYGFSAFLDLDAGPDTLDFAGPGAVPFARVASVRQGFALGEHGSLTLSAEQVDPDLSFSDPDFDATSDNRAPAVVVAARRETPNGHLFAGAALRQLAYSGGDGRDHTLAGGLTVSGSRVIGENDLIVFGVVAGEGIAAYVGDLGGLGLDAVVDADGDLQPLRETGAWIAYTRHWNTVWRSSFTYGLLQLEDAPLLPVDAFRESQYAAVNLVWSPVPSWTMGVELLYGRLETQDGRDGDVTRLQGSLKYDFVK